MTHIEGRESGPGWRKDPYDHRDYLHKPGVFKLPRLKKRDMAALLAEIRDQGQLGSCVGFGIGMNFCSVWKALGVFEEWCSPTYIYNGARFIEGTLDKDAGCNPSNALDWSLKNGILQEHFWPYNGTVLDKAAPSSERISQAIKYSDFAYFRVDNGVEGIMSAIDDGHFVSLGAPWPGQWLAYPPGPDGILSEPDPNAGYFNYGHETCLYDYDLSGRWLLGANSWGKEWGKDGCYWMPFSAIDFFKANGGYDAHYVLFKTIVPPPAPEPTPTPEPTPSKCRWGNTVVKIMNMVCMQELRGRRGRFYYLNRR